MKDRIAVIWNRLGSHPVKMGVLTVTDRDARFTYETDYANTGLPGLGVVYTPQAFAGTIVRPRSEYFDLHPPIQSLVPPRDERNFQRALLQQYLNRLGLQSAPGFETDWEMLIRSGHGAIGHLDVFADDESALEWYATLSRQGFIDISEKLGSSLKHLLTWFDGDAEQLLNVLGPTPSVGGAIPKLSLSIPGSGWNGQIALPTRFGDTDRTDIILKLENTSRYPGIIELEALGLEFHKAAGFEVPRYWLTEINGIPALAIERFDRTGAGGTVFQESIYSILASGSKEVTSHYSVPYDRIGKALDSPHIDIVSDRKKGKLYLLERLVLAMLTGNGDLHLENLSVLEKDGVRAFSPVYDPTPMRAYAIHNALTPNGMSFGDFGDYPEGWKGAEPVDFASAWKRFCKNLNISTTVFNDTVERLLLVTETYPGRVEALNSLPGEHKRRLSDIHEHVRKQFMSL